MQLISSVSVLLIKLQLTLIFPLRTKVIFKFTLGLKLWLVYTIFSAIILSHVLTHSLKSYYPIFLHAFILIFLTILLTNTPRMRSQSIQSTLRHPHFILMTQLTFLKLFILFLFFMQLQNHYHKDGGTGHTKESPAENDRRPGGGLEALDHPEATRLGEDLQLRPPFLGCPGGKQPEPLPPVEARELIVPGKVSSQLFNQDFTRFANELDLPLGTIHISEEDLQIRRYIRLFNPTSRISPRSPSIDRPLFKFGQVVIGIETHERSEIFPWG